MVTIGHDSEFGLSYDGIHAVSALKALKHHELPEGRYFPDNMNAEIAINPVQTLKDFHKYTDTLLGDIRNQGFQLLMKPVIEYSSADLDADAMISGCNPDFCAYQAGEANKAPNFYEMDGTRSCGAHVHVGDSSIDSGRISRWMDIYLGLPLLLREEVNTRRQMYGSAGCFRPKPYGTEYRTLSNVWLDDVSLREFVWEGTHKAIEASKKGDIDLVEQWQDIPQAINTHDINLARRTIDRLYLFGVTHV